MQDIIQAHKIYGPSIPVLKGRTTSSTATRIPKSAVIPIPKSIYKYLHHVTLCIHFHYVNGLTVFHSISRNVSYQTVMFPYRRSTKIILKEIKDIYQEYNARGFRIIKIHIDKEFEKIRTNLLPMHL